MTDLHPLDQYLSKGHTLARKLVRSSVTKPVISTVVSAEIEGEENVEGLDGAYIVIGNHSSHLDAPMMFSLLPDVITDRLATGAAADYFYRKKFVSSLTSLFFNTYPVERRGKSTKAGPKTRGQVRDEKSGRGPASGMTARLLAAGVPILIFPEGTRSRDGRMKMFNSGAAGLSTKMDVPVVPIALIGGHEAMPVGSYWPKLGRPRVKLVIGHPMKARPGESVESFNDRLFDVISVMRATGHPADPDKLAEGAA